MKGNKQIFSSNRAERIKGYKKMFKEQKDSYSPPKDIAKDITEAMEAQGFEISVEEASAYLRASYASFDRKYYLKHRR